WCASGCRCPSVHGRAVAAHPPCAATAPTAVVSVVPGAAPRPPGSRPGTWSELRADELDEVHEPVGVAPLVVVPADHLDLVADDLGEPGVEDAGRGVGDDVG